MSVTESLVIYLTIGCGIAIAVFAANVGRTSTTRLMVAISAVVFWPLYLPLLFSGGGMRNSFATSDVDDELTQLLQRVSSELDAALDCLPPSSTTRTARDHATDLLATWHEQHRRIREIDALLPSLSSTRTEAVDASQPSSGREALESARHGNVEQLRCIRQGKYDELVTSAASVREIVSRIHLSRFADEPSLRPDDIAKQLNAAIRSAAKQFDANAA